MRIHPRKLTDAQAERIRKALHDETGTVKGLARTFSVAPKTIRQIRDGVTYNNRRYVEFQPKRYTVRIVGNDDHGVDFRLVSVVGKSNFAACAATLERLGAKRHEGSGLWSIELAKWQKLGALFKVKGELWVVTEGEGDKATLSNPYVRDNLQSSDLDHTPPLYPPVPPTISDDTERIATQERLLRRQR